MMLYYVFVLLLRLLLYVVHSQSHTTDAAALVNVGIVVDVSNTDSSMWLSCINMASSDFYSSHSHFNTRLHFHLRDSHSHILTAASQGSSFLYFFFLLVPIIWV